MATVTEEVALTPTSPVTGARAGPSLHRARIRLNTGFVAMSLVTLVVAFLVLFPLGMLLYGSFWTSRPGFPGTFTLSNYITAYTSIETYQVFLTTVLLIGTKTLVAVAFATTLAWIVTRTDTP